MKWRTPPRAVELREFQGWRADFVDTRGGHIPGWGSAQDRELSDLICEHKIDTKSCPDLRSRLA